MHENVIRWQFSKLVCRSWVIGIHCCPLVVVWRCLEILNTTILVLLFILYSKIIACKELSLL